MKPILLLLTLLLAMPALGADVTLAWDYSATTHTGFKLRYKMRGTTDYQTVDDAIPPATRQYTHEGAPGGTLLYKLTAFNAAAESAPAYMWVVIDQEPAGPPPMPRNTTTVTIKVTPPAP